MMKYLSLGLASIALVAFSGCISLITGIPGSGVSETEEREVDSFERIMLKGTGDVTISVGKEQSVTITTDDNLMEYVETSVDDGRLVIRNTENINPKVGLKIEVSVPSLTAAGVSGAGNIHIDDVEGESLDLSVSGVGDLTANGTVKNVSINVSGVGSAHTRKLIAENVKVRVSGTGDADVYASESIDAAVSGIGDIECHGNPSEVKKRVSGIGDIDIEN